MIPNTDDILAKVCNIGKSLLGIGSSVCIAKPHPPLQGQQLQLRIEVLVSEFLFGIHYEKIQDDT